MPKKYYFIVANKFLFSEKEFLSYQLTIFDEISDIYLNPSLSQNYYLFQRSNKSENFYYFCEENKNAFIYFEKNSNLTIYENENKTMIFNQETKNSVKTVNFKFLKNVEYNITFKSLKNENPKICFQFFDENEFIQSNLSNSSLLLLPDVDYKIEIDISHINKGDYFSLLFYSKNGYSLIRYQYKKILTGNTNWITLGDYIYSHDLGYILLKKDTDDDKLMLNMKLVNKSDYFNSLELLNYKIEEIIKDGIIEIKEPKVLFLNYFSFNEYNSFGISSNQIYCLIHQRLSNEGISYLHERTNLTITKAYINNPYTEKNILILLDEKKIQNNNYIRMEFKKFNFIIFYNFGFDKVPYIRFYKDNEHKKEYYFYLDGEINEYFLPLFGNYKTYFISKVNKLSDLDFSKTNQINYICFYEPGYLKIESVNKDEIIQHYAQYNDYFYEPIYSGRKYYYDLDCVDKIPIYHKHLNKIIPLKFRVVGLYSNISVTLILDNKNYTINNNPLEINYHYKNSSSKIFFVGDKSLKNKAVIELKFGYLNLGEDEQIDFIDAIGQHTFKFQHLLVIKIPKNFNESLYDYSLIFKKELYYIAEIGYDNLTYAVPLKLESPIRDYPVIKLFKSNPYDNVLKEENKYFYITIENDPLDNNFEFMIKKPKIYNNIIEFNKINAFPLLKEDSKKYYYKIEIPKIKEDFNYFTIEVSENLNFGALRYYYAYLSSKENDEFYELISLFTLKTYHNFENKSNSNSFFINLFHPDEFSCMNIFINKYFYRQYKDKKILNLLQYKSYIEQINQTNKIKIKLNSLSYYDISKKYYYYLFINYKMYYFQEMYFPISGLKKPDVSKKQALIFLDVDDGLNETKEYEADIDTELYNGTITNDYFLISMNAENNIIEFPDIVFIYYFYFTNISNKSLPTPDSDTDNVTDKDTDSDTNKSDQGNSSYLLYYIIVPIGLVIIISIITAIVFIKRRKRIEGNLNKQISDELIALEPMKEIN